MLQTKPSTNMKKTNDHIYSRRDTSQKKTVGDGPGSHVYEKIEGRWDGNSTNCSPPTTKMSSVSLRCSSTPALLHTDRHTPHVICRRTHVHGPVRSAHGRAVSPTLQNPCLFEFRLHCDAMPVTSSRAKAVPGHVRPHHCTFGRRREVALQRALNTSRKSPLQRFFVPIRIAVSTHVKEVTKTDELHKKKSTHKHTQQEVGNSEA